MPREGSHRNTPHTPSLLLRAAPCRPAPRGAPPPALSLLLRLSPLSSPRPAHGLRPHPGGPLKLALRKIKLLRVGTSPNSPPTRSSPVMETAPAGCSERGVHAANPHSGPRPQKGLERSHPHHARTRAPAGPRGSARRARTDPSRFLPGEGHRLLHLARGLACL